MDIGIVITLLFLLLSVAGPLIEKQLKKAGKIEQARTLRRITDTISGDGREAGDERDEREETSPADVPDTPEIRVEQKNPSAATASAPVAPAARRAMPAGQSPDASADARAEVLALALEKYRARKKAKELEQTELSRLKSASRAHVPPQDQPSEKRKLDIDPRKLVIYSEIMKPKF